MGEKIERFRNCIRLQHNSAVMKTTQSAFATEKPSYKGKNQQGKEVRKPPRCLCGDKMWYADYPYLVPSKAPAGWKKDSKVHKAVTDAFKDSKVQAQVKKNIDTREKLNRPVPTSDPANKATMSFTPIALPTTVSSAIATNTSGIGLYLIHDGGSDAHVCNGSSAQLYTKTREAASDEYLGSGTGIIKIESWGVMETAFESPSGLVPIRLENVAFVSSFVTSLVSQSILDGKGVHFDTGGPRLYQEGMTKFLLHRNGGHFTFSAARPPHSYPPHATKWMFTPFTSFPTALTSQRLRTRPANEWHKILAHVSGEAITHLEKAAADIKVSDSYVPTTNQCETCVFTKSQQIISRSSRKSKDSGNPFYRISVNLMQFDPALNGHEWTTHIACMVTDFNFVDTSRTKTGCRQFILDTIALIKRRFNRNVVFIWSDNEGSFSNTFRDELKGMGLTLEGSASDTPAQNGHAERKGKMLAVKARALRISASFPHYLWVEAIHAACYLANRTPMAKHSWKTPFESVTDSKPYLSHLKVYGCKAYALDYHVPRKQKLESRAHIGYLVGYDSTNIFWIWIPSKHKVIRLRDVIFDETKIYDSTDTPDLLHFLSQPLDTAPYLITEGMRSAFIELDIQDGKLSSLLDSFNEPVPSSHDISKDIHDTTNVLPSPSPTPTVSNSLTELGDADTLSEIFEDISGLPTITSRRRPNIAPHAESISADFNTSNILPEGVGRRSTTRRNAYSTQLTFAAQGTMDIFHDSFAAFSLNSCYRMNFSPILNIVALATSRDLANQSRPV